MQDIDDHATNEVENKDGMDVAFVAEAL